MERTIRFAGVVIAMVLLGLLMAETGHADGIMVGGRWPPPDPMRPPEPLPAFAVEYHHVDVTIDGQVARTRIDQVFKSEYNREMEATYIFPIPEGAAINEFSMWIGDKKVEGQVLDADDARRIYEDIVRHRSDPSLLEYVGRGLFKARVFPIPPRGETRIEMEYAELLPRRHDTIRYVYPLDTERFSSKPIESVRLSLDIQSPAAIHNVYSPSHNVSVRRPDDHTATISYEEDYTLPDTDLALYYTVSEDDVGLGLMTFAPGGEDGYFILLASPQAEIQQEEVEAKDVIFVFDRTGSMSGEKMAQAREALKFCLGTLNTGDRFNVIPFNEKPDPLFARLAAASRSNVEGALDLANSLDAMGGTNIDEALTTALPMLERSRRPSYILFLTDGLPTVGVTDIDRILRDAKDAAPENARIFVFGVGYDVNTTLLDKLALQHKGSPEYVRPGEDIEVKVSNLFRMISYPVLTDLVIDYGSMKAYDVYPDEMPDLFKGSQIMLAGRYRGHGKVAITLEGKAGGRTHTFRLAQSLETSSTLDDFIPLIWAQRRIGFLLEEIRLHGKEPELVDEIVRLSKKYGIINEYTSFLVEEPEMLSRRDGMYHLGGRLTRSLKTMEVDVGGQAVNQSINIKASKHAAGAPKKVQTFYDQAGEKVSVSTVRNVQNRAFFKQGNRWVESNYLEDQPVLKIKVFSAAQFQLLERDPSLGELMALGEEVLFLVSGNAVQIGPDGVEELTEEQLDRLF
jgi:Ca-activated chloride channel family protein